MTMNTRPVGNRTAFDVLRAFRRTQTQERCELCGAALAEPHPHLIERATGRLLCSCDPCAVLFSYRDEGLKFARVPREGRRLADFKIDDADWIALALPIDLAFFLNRSALDRVAAYYPSPAGNTESLLTLDYWNDLVDVNPALARMQPDTEALLVNRTRGRRDYYIAPIDECYRLTGVIRLHWRGLSGGEAVWQEIERFFEGLEQRSSVEEARAHA
jgi:hypothetical protein